MALWFGTIYFDIPLAHRENLGVRAAVLVLHTPNELSCFALSPKFQLSITERKRVPPAHKCYNHGVIHRISQHGRWLGQLIF
jgi:hypothetical protein